MTLSDEHMAELRERMEAAKARSRAYWLGQLPGALTLFDEALADAKEKEVTGMCNGKRKRKGKKK